MKDEKQVLELIIKQIAAEQRIMKEQAKAPEFDEVFGKRPSTISLVVLLDWFLHITLLAGSFLW